MFMSNHVQSTEIRSKYVNNLIHKPSQTLYCTKSSLFKWIQFQGHHLSSSKTSSPTLKNFILTKIPKGCELHEPSKWLYYKTQASKGANSFKPPHAKSSTNNPDAWYAFLVNTIRYMTRCMINIQNQLNEYAKKIDMHVLLITSSMLCSCHPHVINRQLHVIKEITQQCSK